jgi:dolichol-phosphate mannosyltransferase
VKLSVVIPAHNEAGHICDTVRLFHAALVAEGVDHEIVVVDDHSSDGTGDLVRALVPEVPVVRVVENHRSGGFGLAVRAGLEAFEGDAVAVVMADASDSPDDLVRFWRALLHTGSDCVFGTRFSGGGRTVDYPRVKLVLNRVANTAIRVMFRLHYDDVTNAFKLYRRNVIDGVGPLLSHHFNLTVELPLKAVLRGYSYAVVPNTWTNRKHGTSKFNVQEMGSRYAFIVLYCLLERWLSRGDYVRPPGQGDHEAIYVGRRRVS